MQQKLIIHVTCECVFVFQPLHESIQKNEAQNSKAHIVHLVVYLVAPLVLLKARSHGVPSSKSHSCQQGPTYEPLAKLLKFALYPVQSNLDFFFCKNFLRTCVESQGLAFCLTELSTQTPSLTSKMCSRVSIHVILKTWDLI